MIRWIRKRMGGITPPQRKGEDVSVSNHTHSHMSNLMGKVHRTTKTASVKFNANWLRGNSCEDIAYKLGAMAHMMENFNIQKIQICFDRDSQSGTISIKVGDKE